MQRPEPHLAVVAATQGLATGVWDWVFVDGEQGGVGDVATGLFGGGEKPVQSKKGVGKKGKKRKREKERGGKGWVDGREGKRQVTWNP